MQKKCFLLFGISLFLCLLFSSSFADQNNPQPDSSNINTFLLQASSATLIQDQKQPGNYVLTLYNVNPYLIYLATKPFRISGMISTQSFIMANSPQHNAVLFGSQLNGQVNNNAETPLLILSSPLFNANKTIIRYLAKPLSSIGLKELRYDYATLVITNE